MEGKAEIFGANRIYVECIETACFLVETEYGSVVKLFL